jgi:hypothetical protein
VRRSFMNILWISMATTFIVLNFYITPLGEKQAEKLMRFFQRAWDYANLTALFKYSEMFKCQKPVIFSSNVSTFSLRPHCSDVFSFLRRRHRKSCTRRLFLLSRQLTSPSNFWELFTSLSTNISIIATREISLPALSPSIVECKSYYFSCFSAVLTSPWRDGEMKMMMMLR